MGAADQHAGAGGGVARGLVEGLRVAGVQRIFGMPGGGSNLDVIGAASAVGIPFTLAHGETAACIMAASYGRSTGTPGVAVVTRGPGFTSAANGLAQATLDRFPLVLISDAVATGDAERVAHQRLDQVATARPLAKWSGILGTANPVGVAEAAARLAVAGPPGGVYLACDESVAGDVAPEVPVPAAVEPEALGRARELVSRARRPVVVVGLDAVGHAGMVRAALEQLDCPVLVTYEAKGVVRESWASFAGLFTGAAIERPLLQQADLILGIGLDPVEALPGAWPYDAPVLLVGTYPVETAYFGSAVQVVGPYGEVLPGLVEGLQPDWPAEEGARIRRADLARLDLGSVGVPSGGSAGMSPHEVVRTTQQVLGKALLTVDAGAHMLVAMPLWQADGESSVLISNGLATMGFALPAAIGLALARPEQRVVCFTGDGGLGMVLAELETVARLGLDITVVAFNDAALTLIALKQREGQGGHQAVRYRPTDFAAVAAGMGVPGEAVQDVDGLAEALTADGSGPRLIDARVNPSSYPFVITMTRG